MRQRIFPNRQIRTFEDWVSDRFGRKLFSMFFQTYSEKLWDIGCDRIDADWASQRIRKLSLFEAVKAALFGNRNRHKTLVDQFAYPKNGTGALYEKLARKIQERGGRILLGVKVKEIITESFRVCAVTDTEGRCYEADQVISTMPITHLVEGLMQKEPTVLEAARKLYFRNTTLVYLEIDQVDVFPDNWIYVHSPQVRHGRITNFRNWCSSLYGNRETTILCMEYWSFDDEPFWKLDDASLKKLAIEEISNPGPSQARYACSKRFSGAHPEMLSGV